MILPLSASRLRLHENCPRAFRYRYLEGMEESFISINAFLGRMVHATLEWLHERVEEGEVPTYLDTLAHLEGRWAEELGSNGEVRIVHGPSDRRWYLARAARAVEAYYWGHHPFDGSERPDGEHPVRELREWLLEFDLAAGLPARGFVDRLLFLADGTIEIHDYKTGAARPPRDLAADPQAALYQLGVRQRHPDCRVVSVWHYLIQGRKLEVEPAPAALEATRSRLLGQVEEIRAAESFPALPGRLCAWCGFQDSCPEGTEHLGRQAKGR